MHRFKKTLAPVGCMAWFLGALCGCQEKPVDAVPATAPALVAPQPAPAPAEIKEAPAAANAASDAKTIFAQRCTLCHGTGGKGDGPAAQSLNPKPRSFADAAWQASATDESVTAIIVQGGAAVGKSMMMPPNPDLKDRPEIIAELVKIVRSFKK